MLLNTFSPKMIKEGCEFTGKSVSLEEVKKACTRPWPWMKNDSGYPMWLCQSSAISHENTAGVLSILLDAKIDFKRENVSLGHNSTVWVVVPNFRTTEAREFTLKEVEAAGMSCYKVKVYDPSLPRYNVRGQAADVGGSLCTGGEFHTLAEAEKAAEEMCDGYYMESTWVEDTWEI